MIRRALEIFRRDGFLVLCFRVLGDTVYRRMLLTGTDMSGAQNQPDARCRWLTSADALAYTRYQPETSVETVRKQLAEGHRCFVLWTPDHQIASGVWIARGRAWIEYLELEIQLDQVEVYVFQSYTPPAHRGQGFSTTVLCAMRHALRLEGFERTVGCVLPDNYQAYAPLYRSGVKPRGYVGWLRLGPWRWTFRRTTNRFPWYAPRPRVSMQANS